MESSDAVFHRFPTSASLSATCQLSQLFRVRASPHHLAIFEGIQKADNAETLRADISPILLEVIVRG